MIFSFNRKLFLCEQIIGDNCNVNTEQNHVLLMLNKSTEYVEKFKHMGTTITNQIYVHKKLRVD